MKRFLAIVLIIVMALSLFAACDGGGDKSGDGSDNNNGNADNGGNNNAETDKKSPEAAFKQFGLDVSQVKPGMGELNETTIQYGNEVNDTVYYRKAAYTETCEADVDGEAGKAYNQRMFDLCKSASADGKVYTNKTNSGDEPQELTSVDDIIDPSVLINLITWSYKIDGMWVDVYMEWSMIGNKIGVTMNGSGTY